MLPAVLYHGTRSGLLPQIARAGVLPRCLSGESNWGHTVESREDAIYLTQAYALYYARACQAKGDPVILEIATCDLDPLLFAADEDGVAQLKEGRALAGPNASLEEATAYWRDRAHTVAPVTSLSSIGNCTYFGPIPAQAIRRVLVLSSEDALRLTVQACDPVVSVMNYQLFGEPYRAFSQWLFDPAGPCPGVSYPVAPPAQAAGTLADMCGRATSRDELAL